MADQQPGTSYVTNLPPHDTSSSDALSPDELTSLELTQPTITQDQAWLFQKWWSTLIGDDPTLSEKLNNLNQDVYDLAEANSITPQLLLTTYLTENLHVRVFPMIAEDS